MSARAQHRLRACTQHHLSLGSTSFRREADTNERCYGDAVNDVALRANEVALCTNEIALRANGISAFPCAPIFRGFFIGIMLSDFQKGGDPVREDKLGDLSMELSVDVLRLTKDLRSKHENVISNQIGRSTTSICANIAESKYAHGRADFIAKLEISLKETNETAKWLEMLWKSDYMDEQKYQALDRKCSTIRFLLVKSITTAKKNLSAAKDKN